MSDDFLVKKILPDGRMAVVVELTFARGRICVGPKDADWYASSW